MAPARSTENARSAAGRALAAVLAGRVSERPSDLLVAAHDASHITITPTITATATSVADVAAAFTVAHDHGLPVTLRSGGTSLSGQAGGSGLILDVRRGFRSMTVMDDGHRVRVAPGMTLRAINTRLAPLGRILGPDPASEVACTIGGVIANNSSGMSCGTHANAYATIESCTVVLPSGTTLRTGDPDADDQLATREPELFAGLSALRDEVRADPSAVGDIRRLFSIKNTMGYAITALLDYDSPARILEHLLVGSEGTLGFIAEAELRTVPLVTHAATALIALPTVAAAAALIPALVDGGADTVELLDATSVRVSASLSGAPDALRTMRDSGDVALLVEVRGGDPTELAHRVTRVQTALSLAGGPLFEPTSDTAARADLWRARKGVYAAVAGMRPTGTTALLEDIAVPVPALAETCRRLTALLEGHGYDDAVIFGHAKDGNLHFMVVEDFTTEEGHARFAAFTDELVDLVLSVGGTLKAEHGTGRVMAPFLERQYGETLTSVMRRIKQLIDPRGVLNPGVIITSDPTAHLRDIVTAPTVEAEVDRCVECGYCEPVCPSRDLTMTPRERIVLRREIARAEAAGKHALAAQLRRAEQYDSVATCAVDGMCATACPVGINTGDLVRRLRKERMPHLGDCAGVVAAQSFAPSSRGVSAALTIAASLPAALPRGVTAAARRLASPEVVPSWTPDLPAGGRRRRPRRAADPDAVFFPACVGTMFGSAGSTPSERAIIELARAAGLELRVPDDIEGLCCGTPWSSKGAARGHALMRERTAVALMAATEHGRLPVVVDGSSCAEGLLSSLGRESRITVLDAIEYVATRILPSLPPVPATARVRRLVLHPTCSGTIAGTTPHLLALAEHVAHEVVIPADWGCCGFAGDRGMLRPELTANATGAEAAAVAELSADAYASTNRPCEIGMTRATGAPYEAIVSILHRAVLPARQ